jgi:acyl-CoA thioesterase-1
MKRLFSVLWVLLSLSVAPLVNAQAAKKIVFLGDSLTAGYGVAGSESYPSHLARLLASKGKKIEVVNSSVSGSTSASGLARVKWVLKSKPSILLIALGSNDGLRGFPVTETKKNIEGMIELAKASNVKVILAGLQVPINYGEKYRQDFKNIFKDLSAKHNVDLVPFLLEGVAGEKSLNQADGIHPNINGYKKIAETVLPVLERNL